METKNFDLAVAEQRGEALTFILGGVTFECPLPMAAMPLLDLAAKSDQGGAEAITAFHSFLCSIVKAEQVKQFQKVLVDARVSLETLTELCEWVISEAVARPTLNPSDSPESSSADSQPMTQELEQPGQETL